MSFEPRRPHPSDLALEAFACDEADDEVTLHVADCAACRDHVVALFVAVYAGRAPRHGNPVWNVS